MSFSPLHIFIRAVPLTLEHDCHDYPGSESMAYVKKNNKKKIHFALSALVSQSLWAGIYQNISEVLLIAALAGRQFW